MDGSWYRYLLGIARRFAYALLLRCPRCGRAPALSGWFTVRRSCPSCHFRFDRGMDGYFLGAGCLNLVVAELVFAGGLLATLVWTWPDPPWNGMIFVGIPAMIIVPVLFFPHSRTIWIAFDLAFHPVEMHDNEPPQANAGGPDGGDASPR